MIMCCDCLCSVPILRDDTRVGVRSVIKSFPGHTLLFCNLLHPVRINTYSYVSGCNKTSVIYATLSIVNDRLCRIKQN